MMGSGNQNVGDGPFTLNSAQNSTVWVYET